MKKLGIIGGLGPLATAYFFRCVTMISEAAHDQDHMEVFIHSKPDIPKRVEYILGKSDVSPTTALVSVARGLQSQGAEVLAMPCVTAHYFYDEIAGQVEIPIINMVDETIRYLLKQNIASVGILATEATVRCQYLQGKLIENGIQVLVPDAMGQRRINEIIFDQIKVGKEPELSGFYRTADELFLKGAQINLLACTELSILKQTGKISEGYLDMMDVLAMEAVKRCGILKT